MRGCGADVVPLMNAAMAALTPSRDDHWESLEGHFAQEPRKGRMTGLGQRATFTTPLRNVRLATANRHSRPSVRYASVNGP